MGLQLAIRLKAENEVLVVAADQHGEVASLAQIRRTAHPSPAKGIEDRCAFCH
jgi:hypothetical protein